MIILVFGILISLFGLFLIFFPNLYWQIAGKKKSPDEETEPSLLYLRTTRVRGTWFVAAGVVVFVLQIMNR